MLTDTEVLCPDGSIPFREASRWVAFLASLTVSRSVSRRLGTLVFLFEVINALLILE